MESRKVTGIESDVVFGTVLLIGGYFVWQKIFGSTDPGVPKTTSTWSGTQIPVSTSTTNTNTPSAAKENAVDFIANYLNTRGVNDPFGAGPYTANPDASNLTFDQLSSIAGAIHDAGPGTFFWLTSITGDWTKMMAQIQQYCSTQIDVSNLSIVFQQLYGQDMLTWMYDVPNLGNPAINGGISNVEGLQKIIQYVLALPPQ